MYSALCRTADNEEAVIGLLSEVGKMRVLQESLQKEIIDFSSSTDTSLSYFFVDRFFLIFKA